MNTILISTATTAISLGLAIQVSRQYWRRRRTYQLVWSAALFLFAVGAGCQLAAGVWGWSTALYKLWYLSGAILTAAYLGQGTLYLQARRRTAHVVMGILLLASLYAALAVWRAPVDLGQALAGASISGQGMPKNVRLLTPFFNVFGTLLLVGGALRSSWFFLWNGGGNSRAAGTALIAVGALVVAFGGTLARFNSPAALYVTEMTGVATIFAGFWLTDRREQSKPWTPESLAHRRKRVTTWGVGFGVVTLLGLVASLPVLPWTMGIVTSAKHVYIDQVPEENRGFYLLTDQGVMQIFTWNLEPGEFPNDAPSLEAHSIRSMAVVQKLFDQPENYRLYNLTEDHQIPWQSTHSHGMQLYFQPQSLSPGEYMFVAPTDSMYGGKTWHYFRLE